MKPAPDHLHAGLRSVLDTALDAVVVMGIDGLVLGWNENAAATFGWTAEEAVGRRLSDLIIPREHRDAHERGLAHYLATGEGPVLNRHIEINGCHREGREIPVELSITESNQFGGRLFIGFLRDISDRRAAAERQQRLLRELNHRVKNMLSVVMAVAYQTARSAPDMKSFERSFAGRLETLARGHDLLIASQWGKTDLEELAAGMLGADAEAGRVSFGGDRVLLSANRVLGMALVLHELYTNAVKYGALAVEGARVELDWRADGDEVVLNWRETGVHPKEKAGKAGFGREMIAMTAKADLGGAAEFQWEDEGLVVTIRFPMRNGA